MRNLTDVVREHDDRIAWLIAEVARLMEIVTHQVEIVTHQEKRIQNLTTKKPTQTATEGR